MMGNKQTTTPHPHLSDPTPPSADRPPRSAYVWYLTSSSLWMAGVSLQGFLFTKQAHKSLPLDVE